MKLPENVIKELKGGIRYNEIPEEEWYSDTWEFDDEPYYKEKDCWKLHNANKCWLEIPVSMMKYLKSSTEEQPKEKSKKSIGYDMENVENEIEGYKYVLELSVNVNDDPFDTTSGDRICICDTRDECIEQIKKEIAMYVEANERCGFKAVAEPYNITRLGTYIKWHKDGDVESDDKIKSWWWNFGIYPVRYLSGGEEKSACY